MSEECIFCQIVAGDIPSDHVASDDGLVAFRDISPRAPAHVLVVPERHIPSAHDLTEADEALLGRCFALARRVAEQEGIADGYRVVTNIGERGGQAVFHLHFHVLGGKQLGTVDGRVPESA
ncbi:histidine triad nucleotide-binding protein [Egibacter rhizosphaerae]|uniref:Histidine triad nucleotide-binding protein n=1 Tax=Egibacter rhizosphaerae TaxID=1670831 RepID=A0A411YBK3_9ACTN|nr:histidine triad nucleotide-binding protein [Egibacter rhizosphaerae]QBI18633.1 histidine triad nucleotide-binding protein [Egibacter rhizosphaerae]